MVECLPSTHKALDFITQQYKNKIEKEVWTNQALLHTLPPPHLSLKGLACTKRNPQCPGSFSQVTLGRSKRTTLCLLPKRTDLYSPHPCMDQTKDLDRKQANLDQRSTFLLKTQQKRLCPALPGQTGETCKQTQ